MATAVQTRVAWDYLAQPLEYVPCNLCGSVDTETLATTDRYGFPARTVRCERCALVYLNPRMTKDAYAKFYRDGIYRQLVSKFHGREINAKTIQPEQLVYAEQVARFLEPHVRTMDGTLLDIGGSTGVVARALAERFGLNASVLDPAVEELKEASDLYVIEGSIETENLGAWTFGVVTMCQTADHLLNIRAALRTIREATRDGGLFFVDIVDWDQTHVSKVDHPYNLTRATMLSYLSRAGFRLVDEARAEDGIHWRFLCR